MNLHQSMLSIAAIGLALSLACPADGAEPQAGTLKAGLARFRLRVRTEDPVLNRALDRIYTDCFFGKEREPSPPSLPYTYLGPGGIYEANPERQHGQAIWDTAFMLSFYAPWGDSEIIRGMFLNFRSAVETNPDAPRGSYRYGMIPCCLLRKGWWPPVPFSQFPLAAWGLRMVAAQTNDRELMESSLPYLVDFDRWYSSERDVDGDGLIEVGSYGAVAGESAVQCARYESFDWQSTLDDLKLTKHPTRKDSGEWYGNVEGVDETSFLILSEKAIADMARQLGQADLARRYDKIVAWRSKQLREKMWNPQTGFFHSLDRDSGRLIPDRTIQGFLPMACGAASREQAAILVQQLQDPRKFWCAYPVPTQAMDDPKYSAQGVWRGDVWPPTNYFVCLGLNEYGYYDLAADLCRKTMDLITSNSDTVVNERYDGTTGRPLGSPGLPMSSSTWLAAPMALYGIQTDFRTIRVPSHPKGRKLAWGDIEIYYPDDNTVELRSAFERQLKVIFPDSAKVNSVSVACGKESVTSAPGATVSFGAQPGKTYVVQAKLR